MHTITLTLSCSPETPMHLSELSHGSEVKQILSSETDYLPSEELCQCCEKGSKRRYKRREKLVLDVCKKEQEAY